MNADEDGSIPIHPRHPRLTEQPLHDFKAFLECRRKVFRLVSTTLSHVGFATTTPTYHWRELFNHLPRRDLARQVSRRAHDERDFSITTAPKHNYTRLDPGKQRV